MLHSIVLLSDSNTLFSNWPADSECRICPSLLIEGSDEQKIKAAYQYCSGQQTNKFTISVVLNTPLPDAIVQYIISFLFLPNYFTPGNRIEVMLVGKDNTLAWETKQRLIACSYRQGIKNLVVHHLIALQHGTAGPVSANPFQTLFYSSEDLLHHYKYCLENPGNGNLSFFLYDPQIDAANLYKRISALEDETKKIYSMQYQLATENQSLLKENELLKKKYAAVANELNNYKLHLEMLRSSHQAKEIQEYYNKAYESLPLWYKRVGHLVKAFTGKRSFRSLFTDKVKKQKV